MTYTPDVPVTLTRVSLFRRITRDPLGLASCVVLALIILAAVFGPLFVGQDPNTSSLKNVMAPPSPAHLLGGDAAGRDVFSRLLSASRFSLLGAAIALVTSIVFGVISGLIAGYYARWFDNVSSWLTNLIMALPGIMILLAARSVIGPSMWWSMLIFGIILSPSFFRLVRSLVHTVRDELFVDAARVSGLSDLRIIFRHVLSVVRAPIIIQAAMVSVIAIAVQSGLDFLGLGDMSVPTWGSMLNEAYSKIYVAPVLLVWPGIMIALTCSALVLLATAMRDALERTDAPKRRKRAVVAQKTAQPAASLSTTESAAAPLLKVAGLKVGYDQPDGSSLTVVRDVSFEIRSGEILGLVGESGSGKTQTAFSILRLLPAGGRITGGSIQWNGRDLESLSEPEMRRMRGAKIAYIPQEPMSNLDPSFTIGSQLIEPMRAVLGISKAEAHQRALELLARVGITDPARTMQSYPHQVSGGMAQRILIAGAVSCNAELIIADEPTSALDVTVQADVLDLLRGLQQERQLAVILVTHNFGVVSDLCDRVAVMRQGEVIEEGPVRSVFLDPQQDYTRSLLGAILDEDGPVRPALAISNRGENR